VTREADIIARLGGDEFVIVLENLSEDTAEAAGLSAAIAEKILQAVARPYLLEGHECLTTCSLGVTIFGDRQHGLDDIMQQADIAMYQAKSSGRNSLRFFAPALQAAVNARASLEEDLRRAIGTTQFRLFYQPQVERDMITGAEALLRWNHPQRGLLSPIEFIPLAEETGLILPLGDWIIETAFAEAATWECHSDATPMSIAVNISARQFRQADFVEQVLQTIRRTGIDPHRVILELTESMLADNLDDLTTKMAAFKSFGVRLAIDDFGTGYSSLSYIRQLPLDQLKIDRSFVRDMLNNHGSGAIAKTIISLSEAMGLSVIAEGVETVDQRDFLINLCCDSFQGYLFSPSVPPEQFESMLKSAHQRHFAPLGVTGSEALQA
jgi:EAL domain-containing protein (putative c-di-GMP-specific phosphodiesterase class I)